MKYIVVPPVTEVASVVQSDFFISTEETPVAVGESSPLLSTPSDAPTVPSSAKEVSGAGFLYVSDELFTLSIDLFVVPAPSKNSSSSHIPALTKE